MKTEPLKPGIKTSECKWAAVGPIVLGLLAWITKNPLIGKAACGAAVILPAVYMGGRALLKAEREKKTNVIPDQAEKTIAAACNIAETLAGVISAALPAIQPPTAPTSEADDDEEPA